MAIYLLIGPSGSGKTTACEIISQESEIKIFDLDKVLKEKIGGSLSAFHLQNGDQALFDLSKEAILDIEQNSKSKTIIVVGAGSINLDSSHKWYTEKQLIALTGNEEKIYDRGNRKKFHPSLQAYINAEFSPSRKNLYQKSKLCIDVTDKTPEGIANELIDFVNNTPNS